MFFGEQCLDVAEAIGHLPAKLCVVFIDILVQRGELGLMGVDLLGNGFDLHVGGLIGLRCLGEPIFEFGVLPL